MIKRDRTKIPIPPAKSLKGGAKYHALLTELDLHESFVVDHPAHMETERNLIHVTARRMHRAVAIRALDPHTFRVWRIK